MTVTAAATHLTLTADELDAIARRLGARRFPGVGASIYDDVPAAHHRLLTDRLLAAAMARGILAERGGRLIAAPQVALLLGPSLRGSVSYTVERADSHGARSTTALGAANGAVVWHRADAGFHRFEVLRSDGDVAAALMGLLAAPDGPVVAAGQPFRRRRSQLEQAGDRPGLVPESFAAIADLWGATTTLTQVGAPNGSPGFSWLTVVDAGPGRIWTVEPDPRSPDDGLLAGDDPVLTVTPTATDALETRLAAWCGCVAAA
jgi:hypothetical protein